MVKKALVTVIFAGFASLAFAQQPVTTPQQTVPHPEAASISAEQQAQAAKQNQEMATAALQVAQLVDQGKSDDVWAGASAVLKQVSPHDVFIKQTMADRKTLGTPRSRNVRQVARVESDGKSFPVGAYFNVTFATTFTNAKQPVRELVSFHLDADKTWRVSGYTVR